MNLRAQPIETMQVAAGAKPTGPGAAAILAAGVGYLALAIFAIAGDNIAGLRRFFAFYRLTGPLSGVTTCGLIVWLICWTTFHVLWRAKQVRLGPVNFAAILMLILGFLLMFPPIADFF